MALLESHTYRLMTRAAWQSRVIGGLLALLVQAGLTVAVFLSLTRPFFFPAPKETTLWLRPLPRAIQRPVLRTIDARGPSNTRPAAIPNTPVSAPTESAGPSKSDLSAFGRALFGCAPEHYAELSPEDRAHCPKPGGEMVYQPPDLMGGPSHVKNNERWANALAHEQSQLLLPGGLLFPLVTAMAALDGSITERSSAFRDPEKWPSYVDPSKLMPRDLHDQERIYDAWHRDHPVK